MTAQEYIDKFRMNQENFEFSRQEFIAQLKFDFLESIVESIHKHPKWDPEQQKLRYVYFKEVVKEFQAKFRQINSLKRGKPLSQGLWKAFFAAVVVPYRKEHYPKIQDHIEKLRILGEYKS